MLKKTLIAVIPLVVGLIAAGCGSSNNSTTTKAAQTSGGTPTSSSSSSYANGAYGSTQSSVSASPAASITTKSDKLGTVLAFGPKRLTVYLFEGDKGSGSSCSGACASAWPPVTGTPKATGGAMSSELGTIKRADGTTQVTYKGHPLYLFVKDKDDGDTYGQGIKGFGASWYAVAPSGNKVDLS